MVGRFEISSQQNAVKSLESMHINRFATCTGCDESSISQNRSRGLAVFDVTGFHRGRSQPARFYLRFVANDGNKGKL